VPLRLQRELGVSGTEEVVFTQLTAETDTYRDAVRFRNGAELLLQRLDPDQRVDVVSLCATETSEQPMTAHSIQTGSLPLLLTASTTNAGTPTR
jgi:hypothetical protein